MIIDRNLVYDSSIPLSTDILSTNKNAMLGLGYALQDILGSATQAAGLACAPTGPATMQVQVGPGRIYSLQNIDNTAYADIAADTTHQVVKQGISLNNVLLSCPAPTTTGFSINYLIEASFSEVDGQNIVLNYYNSVNPAVPFSGVENNGIPQPTVRQGLITLTAKAGIPATTGTQITPAADSGFIGLYVVTVAFGASTIVSGNIAQVPGAPFISSASATYGALVGTNIWTGTNTFNGTVAVQGGSGSDLNFKIGIPTIAALALGFNDTGSTNIYGAPTLTNYIATSQTQPVVVCIDGILTAVFSHNVALTVNGIATQNAMNVISANGTTGGIADLTVSRAGSTINTVGAGPNICLVDNTNTNQSCLQNSGGQTELWQNNAGTWHLIFKTLTTLGTQFPNSIGVNGSTPPAQPTGYGTPTGGSHQASFAAGSITLANLAAAVAQLIIDLKSYGLLAA